MELLELFDRPLPWKWKEMDESDAIAEFEISDGSVYLVYFRRPSMPSDPTKSGNWDFWFDAHGEAATKADSPTGIYNTGVGVEVFSTVKDILTTFLDKYDPDELTFNATQDEPSRVKLYNRMMQLFKSSGYNVEVHNGTYDVGYTISPKRIDRSV